MGKWHYQHKEEIVCSNPKDVRAGMYMAYDIDTYDYILNNNDWVFQNGAIDEQQYILDHIEMVLESSDGEWMYVPCHEVAMKGEIAQAIFELENDIEHDDYYDF